MQLQQKTLAYEKFVEAHALYTGKSEDEIRAEISPEQFEAHIHELHQQWLAGAFSFGRLTEVVQVAHLELWEILDALGLPRHR